MIVVMIIEMIIGIKTMIISYNDYYPTYYHAHHDNRAPPSIIIPPNSSIKYNRKFQSHAKNCKMGMLTNP